MNKSVVSSSISPCGRLQVPVDCLAWRQKGGDQGELTGVQDAKAGL
jgi:hypothetical protein